MNFPALARKCLPDIAAHLRTASLWAVGLAPAYVAIVVLPRPEGPPPPWGTAGEGVEQSTWRLQCGMAYASGVATLLLLTVVFALLARCAQGRTERRTEGRGTDRYRLAVAAAFLALYAAPVVAGLIGAPGGPHGGALPWRPWLPPLLVAAVHLAPQLPMSELLRLLRRVLRVYTWGSLVALVVVPGWATTTNYSASLRLDWLIEGRLTGLTNHPIALGVLAALALVLEAVPLYRAGWWKLHLAVAATVLLLSQSRTAWVAGLLGVALLYRRDVPYRSVRSHPLFRRGLAVAVVGGTALLIALFGGLHLSVRELTTLHGRNLPWDAALAGFHTNVWLGYGPTLFEVRASPAKGAFDHAHNQLFQTLGTAGLLGAATLLAALAVLVLTALRTASAVAGLSWALTGLTLVVCVPEAPFRDGLSAYLLLGGVLVTVLQSALTEQRDQQEHRDRQDQQVHRREPDGPNGSETPAAAPVAP